MALTNTITPAVHVRLEGYTGFFRYTGLITGNQLTLACPSYANLLGLISACAGKVVRPQNTKIGFEFNHASVDEDLERTDRLALRTTTRTTGKGKDKTITKTERLQVQAKGQGIVRRQTHFMPTLDLYLNNLALAEAFNNPVTTPTLGRSQDICWIKKVEQVELTPVASGKIGSTMIGRPDRIPDPSIPSDIVVNTEWFSNDNTGYTRTVQATGYYQVIEPDDGRIQVTTANLYHPSNLPDDQVIYLHEWSIH